MIKDDEEGRYYNKTLQQSASIAGLKRCLEEPSYIGSHFIWVETKEGWAFWDKETRDGISPEAKAIIERAIDELKVITSQLQLSLEPTADQLSPTEPVDGGQ